MIVISGDSSCVFKSASWLRRFTRKSPWENLDDEFECQFNCRVVRRSGVAFDIEFDNDSEATMFQLKWS
jgi:hypothetical protein